MLTVTEARLSSERIQTEQIADIQAFRAEATALVLWTFAVLTFGIFVSGVWLMRVPSYSLYGVVASLGSVVVITYLLLQRHPLLAAISLVVGSWGSTLLAVLLFPTLPLSPWLILITLVSGMLLGWQGAAMCTLATTTIPLLLTAVLGINSSMETLLWETPALAWIALLLSWLATRPTTLALKWAWQSYAQAHHQVQEARARQAELTRLSKTLNETTHRLRQLNADLERAEQAAREARRLKNEFANMISHELRTPLNLIIGFCEMMVLARPGAYPERLPACYLEDLRVVHRNACHLSSLIDDILDLSQIEADRMALHREWTDLGQIVHDAIATVGALFAERSLWLHNQLPELLPKVYVDPTRIRQILINLLANAAPCTVEGGATIGASLDTDAAHLHLTVADTGPGIPAAEIVHVFEEFRQGSGTPWRRQGNGLGLAVSKRFAELHGGTITVTSIFGKGSTFTVVLPLRNVELSQQQAILDGVSTHRIVRELPPRILVLDDTGFTARVFERYLDRLQIVHARTWAMVRRLTRDPVQAVILGGSYAHEEVHAIAALPHHLRQLPVIICPLTTPEQAAKRMGVNDFIIKPITHDRLRESLNRIGALIRTVLVIDDDVEMATLMARILRSFYRGCQVIVTHDAETALLSLHETAPDLVILDLLLPGISGQVVIDAMRQNDTLVNVPIIVITGWAEQDGGLQAEEIRLIRLGGLEIADLLHWTGAGLQALLLPRNSGLASSGGLPEKQVSARSR